MFLSHLYHRTLLETLSIVGWIYDSISFAVAPPNNLTSNFPNLFDSSQPLMSLMSLMTGCHIITDKFLFFEFLLLLLMLFFLFESVTILFLLCTFKAVISCFGMLLLLCLRPNYFDFCNGNAIVVVFCKCWKLVWWSCILIRNGYHVIFLIFVRFFAFFISKREEPVWWNYEPIRNITWFFLTLKRLVGQFDPPCGFSENVFFSERVKLCFFVIFNIIISHIFPENFIKNPQLVQKIWRFSSFFGFFDISLLQRTNDVSI